MAEACRRHHGVSGAMIPFMEQTKWFPNPGLFIKRVGYSGFISLIWMLYQQNRNAKRLGITAKYEIILPVRWMK